PRAQRLRAAQFLCPASNQGNSRVTCLIGRLRAMRTGLRLWVWTVGLLLLAGCGGGSLSNSGSGGGGGPTTPTADHVFLVVLENHSFSQVIGNPAMPYLNSLATQNSLAANYFANLHPSIGNYFMLTTGQIVSADDGFTGVVSTDNLVRALAGAGKTWKAYMESIPSTGYLGGDVLPYMKRHDPFAYFTDVAGPDGQHATAQAANIVHDAHDCPGGGIVCPDSELLAAADAWLKTNIDPLIHSPAFANSVLII